jgi:hypothetical protein
MISEVEHLFIYLFVVCMSSLRMSTFLSILFLLLLGIESVFLISYSHSSLFMYKNTIAFFVVVVVLGF